MVVPKLGTTKVRQSSCRGCACATESGAKRSRMAEYRQSIDGVTIGVAGKTMTYRRNCSWMPRPASSCSAKRVHEGEQAIVLVHSLTDQFRRNIFRRRGVSQLPGRNEWIRIII